MSKCYILRATFDVCHNCITIVNITRFSLEMYRYTGFQAVVARIKLYSSNISLKRAVEAAFLAVHAAAALCDVSSVLY